MRDAVEEIEQYRIPDFGQWSSTSEDGPNGVFLIPFSEKVSLACFAASRIDWEQVGVFPVCGDGYLARCPTWEEMCFVKNLFWQGNETVLQFHPSKSEYVNLYPFMLHLWKMTFVDHPLPPQDYLADRDADGLLSLDELPLVEVC